MILPAIAFVGGLALMGRSKPKTSVRKLICLGPRSGLIYSVEDFPEIQIVVVRAPGDRAIAQFQRAAVRQPGSVGLVYQHGRGDPLALQLIARDFGIEPKKPVAVPSSPEPQEVRAPSKTERELYETIQYRPLTTLSPAELAVRDLVQRYDAAVSNAARAAQDGAKDAPKASPKPAAKASGVGRSTP